MLNIDPTLAHPALRLRWGLFCLIFLFLFLPEAPAIQAQAGNAICATFLMGSVKGSTSFTGANDPAVYFQDCNSGEAFLVKFNWNCPAGQMDFQSGKCKVPVLRPDNNCYQVFNPVISALNPAVTVLPPGGGGEFVVRKQITAISAFTQFASCQACPVKPAPPSLTPTQTRLPPTRTLTPTLTIIPSRTITPTLRIVTLTPTITLTPPPPARSDLLELPVTPLNQHHLPPVVLSNGQNDSGDLDCFIASMAMALDYFKSKEILSDADTPSYRALTTTVRGTIDPSAPITNDPAFVQTVTNGKLSASPFSTDPANLGGAIESELKAGRPVVALASNMSLLAARLSGGAHSILVYGLHDGRIYYVDPWNANRYDMSIQDFSAADRFNGSSFMIKFDVTAK